MSFVAGERSASFVARPRPTAILTAVPPQSHCSPTAAGSVRCPNLQKCRVLEKVCETVHQSHMTAKNKQKTHAIVQKNSKRLRFDKKTSEIHAYCARAAVSQQRLPSSSLPAAASQQQPPSGSLPAAASLQQPPGTSSTAEARRNPKIAGKRSASSVATA